MCPHSAKSNTKSDWPEHFGLEGFATQKKKNNYISEVTQWV